MSLMKRVGLMVIVVMLMTACGSGAADDQGVNNSVDQQQSSENTREELGADFADDALSPASQLVVGTMLLEDTDLAVDTELASTLIPYWKLYKTLLGSDAAAQEEKDALILEIQDLMTPDQVNYIAELQLTQEDLMTLVDELGIIGAEGIGEGDGTGINRPDGMPDGVSPGGGQGRGGGTEGLDPETIATMEAKREEMGGEFFGGNRMVIPLIDELVSQLEEKAGS